MILLKRILLLSPLLLTGCLATNISQLVAAMGTNTNQVSISIRTVYGSIEIQRNQPGRILTP
jgi:hypothetical protein